MKAIDEELFRRSISNKVKKFRTISQEELAHNANISEDTISRIERGTSTINSLTLVKLCNALSVTPNDLLQDFLEVKLDDDDKFYKEILKLSKEEKEGLLPIINLLNRDKK